MRTLLASIWRWLDRVGEAWLGYSVPPVEHALADAAHPARAAGRGGGRGAPAGRAPEREVPGARGAPGAPRASGARWGRDPPEAYCHRCGASIGAGEATARGCASCRGLRPPYDEVVRLGAYVSPLREWVLDIKYRLRWFEMAEWLGAELGRAVFERLEAAGDAHEAHEAMERLRADRGRLIIVPVPMPRGRRLVRGIDHAAVLAAGAAGVIGAPMVPILTRGGGVPQAALSAAGRARTGALGLGVRRRIGGWRLDDLDAILIDDVRTTGATLRQCSRLLKRLGARGVIAAVVAVADEPGRRAVGRVTSLPGEA